MFNTYQPPVYDYQRSVDQQAGQIAHHPLIIVGAGPIGLAAGLDAGVQGMPALILDDNNTVSVGSRAVCYSKRALEVLDRLGCAGRMVEKGVCWKVGKMFFQDQLVSSFDLLPEAGYSQPAFINLQQYYLEEYMVDRAGELDQVEIRWQNRVSAVEQQGEQVVVSIETPDGPYQLSTDWLIVADGANSSVRSMMGLSMDGRVFRDRFLIADIIMKADFPSERWFSFDPSYHPGQSTLLHSQPDNVWRLDFQLGWDKDPEEEKKPENIIPRVKAMMGEAMEFELEWASVYTFMCRRMERFRHGRVIFAGDAAHQVSPFGARGANSGFQDSDNLIWKLRLVMQGLAPQQLIDSYCEEREFAADENLMNSTRATDFITPKSDVSLQFRNATLALAKQHDFARKLVNSGRLSDPAILSHSSLNTPDADPFDSPMLPGAVMEDAPIEGPKGEGWALQLVDHRFQLLCFCEDATRISAGELQQLSELAESEIPLRPLLVYRRGTPPAAIAAVHDSEGLMAQRYDGRDGSCFLIRPDQHLAARWRSLDCEAVRLALNTATCNL
ncbi:FAD-dependent oxidoreductase [Marinobacterium jannaschii]|uniref:FAD-dependent oxidoreductase n=1 Tax=Marinobacterium jannaschii TaxID=64970 RepID=UPI0004880550|nr:FAD-dependent oxidoreductase [Marinobacterium jannaschii]